MALSKCEERSYIEDLEQFCDTIVLVCAGSPTILRSVFNLAFSKIKAYLVRMMLLFDRETDVVQIVEILGYSEGSSSSNISVQLCLPMNDCN